MALKRQVIVDAIQDRMQLINGAGSYYLNVSSNVYVQRDAPFESWNDREIPGINIVDADETLTNELLNGESNLWWQTMDVAIQLVSNGALADANIRKGIIDIKKAIGLDLTWSGNAIDTKWVSTTIAKDQEEQRILSATVNIQVMYQTVQWAEE